MTPSIDYYHGRSVTSIAPADEEVGTLWSIILEGGVAISNHSDAYPSPEGLVGLALQKTEFSSHGTRVYFGTAANPMQSMVNLDPSEYSLSDPDISEGERHFPQRSDAGEGLETPADPSDARVLEQPLTTEDEPEPA